MVRVVCIVCSPPRMGGLVSSAAKPAESAPWLRHLWGTPSGTLYASTLVCILVSSLCGVRRVQWKHHSQTQPGNVRACTCFKAFKDRPTVSSPAHMIRGAGSAPPSYPHGPMAQTRGFQLGRQFARWAPLASTALLWPTGPRGPRSRGIRRCSAEELRTPFPEIEARKTGNLVTVDGTHSLYYEVSWQELVQGLIGWGSRTIASLGDWATLFNCWKFHRKSLSTRSKGLSLLLKRSLKKNLISSGQRPSLKQNHYIHPFWVESLATELRHVSPCGPRSRAIQRARSSSFCTVALGMAVAPSIGVSLTPRRFGLHDVWGDVGDVETGRRVFFNG